MARADAALLWPRCLGICVAGLCNNEALRSGSGRAAQSPPNYKFQIFQLLSATSWENLLEGAAAGLRTPRRGPEDLRRR